METEINQVLKEVNHVLERALSLCRSAKSIAERKGEQTNWDAFVRGIDDVLKASNTLRLPDSVRGTFESWVRETPYFAHCEGEELTRDGLGYEDATVHGAWMGYLRNMPPQPASAPTSEPSYSLMPQVPVIPSKDDDGTPF